MVVVLGALFTKARQDVIKQTLKRELKQHIEKPFQIYFHDGRADINSQIADYCSWAIYRSVEDEETRPLNAIEDQLLTPLHIFKKGTTEYYGYPKS